ncbi:MAG: hypothetical protein NT159_20890 [Proteobacteria bacterium]|nr:hypothetical protein [Pseudomonadota bacterium]
MAYPLIFLVALLLTGTLYGWSRPSRVQIAFHHLFAGLAKGISWLAVMIPILMIGPIALMSMLIVYVLIPLIAWTVIFVLARIIIASMNLLPELNGLAVWHALPEWAWHGLGTVITGGLIYAVWSRPFDKQT